MDIAVSRSRIKNVVDNILNRYVTSVELRTAIDPALDFVCMSMVSLFREDRLATYISSFNDEIDNLGKSKIDWEFIKSDEFSDFLVRATDIQFEKISK
jgi:hypothetical protein